MSSSQTQKNNLAVSDTGVGMQSNSQRRASGNKFMTVRERDAHKRAKSVIGKKKVKKAKKVKKDAEAPLPPPPVQLPEPTPEEELGLIGNL